MWMLGVVFAYRNAYVAAWSRLIALIQVSLAMFQAVYFPRFNRSLRVSLAVAFPAVIPNFEGVNLQCL